MLLLAQPPCKTCAGCCYQLLGKLLATCTQLQPCWKKKLGVSVAAILALLSCKESIASHSEAAHSMDKISDGLAHTHVCFRLGKGKAVISLHTSTTDCKSMSSAADLPIGHALSSIQRKGLLVDIVY